MMFELNFDVTFNRPVTEEDTVCFDTCEMTMDGKEYSFDFFETSISTTRKDSRTLHVERTKPDFYNFTEAAKIGRRELKNVEKSVKSSYTQGKRKTQILNLFLYLMLVLFFLLNAATV